MAGRGASRPAVRARRRRPGSRRPPRRSNIRSWSRPGTGWDSSGARRSRRRAPGLRCCREIEQRRQSCQPLVVASRTARTAVTRSARNGASGVSSGLDGTSVGGTSPTASAHTQAIAPRDFVLGQVDSPHPDERAQVEERRGERRRPKPGAPRTGSDRAAARAGRRAGRFQSSRSCSLPGPGCRGNQGHETRPTGEAAW